MNIKYYHDFIGGDNVLNRLEIQTSATTVKKEVEATTAPITLEYPAVRKLEPIKGSQATIGLISKSNFQFADLHTDNMQAYMVKFYRNSKLYWLGWLDAELYNEQLSASPPYPVEFSAADFNIWERLKYRDENEKRHTDIVPFITHLKRCFERLNLPFSKLYVGCTTTPNGVAMSASETPLHVLYMMSQNFYDEDNEPMTCREVIESILQPFGIVMVQKDASVYIYDYNTIKQGLPMKRYNFSSFAYEADETVNFNLGNLVEIGFASTDGDYGFEEMVNNVTITSSLYASEVDLKTKVDEDSVGDPFQPNVPQLNAVYYRTAKGFDNLKNEGFFVVFYGRNLASYVGERDTISGGSIEYTPSPSAIAPIYRVRYPNYITKVEIPEGQRKSPYYINLKVSAYSSTADQPMTHQKAENVTKSGVLKAFCNLYMVNEAGQPTAYYNNTNEGTFGWNTISSGSIQQGKCVLWFSSDNTDDSILDMWVNNANKVRPMNKPTNSKLAIDSSLVGSGLFVDPEHGGNVVFEITNSCLILDPVSEKQVDSKKIKMVLFNEVSISIVDRVGGIPETDDYEFKSYVNKKVASDFDEITLKCISANEEKVPVGRANILMKKGYDYEYQTSYTRACQTDILERLLMCTIHSNFTTKNEKMSVDVNMTDNPALSYVSCNPILSGEYLVTGCALDFHAGVTTISAVGYSDDVMELSNIPYDE